MIDEAAESWEVVKQVSEEKDEGEKRLLRLFLPRITRT